MLSNNSRPADLPSFCKSSSLPLLKRLSNLFCPVSRSPRSKTAILPSSWILSIAHQICLLFIQHSPDTAEEHANKKNYVKLSQMKHTWWRKGFCQSLPANTAAPCHCSDTMLLGMQTECSIIDYTADFAASKIDQRLRGALYLLRSFANIQASKVCLKLQTKLIDCADFSLLQCDNAS